MNISNFAAITLVVLTCSKISGAEGEAIKTPRPIYSQKAIGELSQKERDAYRKLVKEKSKKRPDHRPPAGAETFWGGDKDPWEHTEHQYGFLPFKVGDTNPQPITAAHSVIANKNLARIDIRLDKLRIADYPGDGRHFVLFTFEAENQVTGGTGQELIRFNQTYEAEEGEGAGVSGKTVFIGLNATKRGASFKGATINVKNADDEKALSFLKSPAVNQGLALLTTAQPVVAPFVEIAKSLGEMLFTRNENKKVQEFYLGLDYDDGAAFGARLREGNYIVVQAPDNRFKWDDWVYESADARVVHRISKTPIPFNYIIFRVSEHKD